MDIKAEILDILENTMVLNGRSAAFTETLPVLSSLPEMDSMVVVSIITNFEDRFGFTVEDEDISGETFHNLGSLVHFVHGKLQHIGHVS